MTEPFLIGDWLVEPDRNTFTRGGEVVRVEPKVMEFCLRLTRQPGAVVSKTELLESVWSDTTVGEDALTRAVSELRRALGDDARRPRIVETIPKRGYRLIAAVQLPAAHHAANRPSVAVGGRWRPRVASVIVLVLIAAGLVAWMRPTDTRRQEPRSPVQVLLFGFQDSHDHGAAADRIRQLVQSELELGGRASVVPATAVAQVLARMRRSGSIGDLASALEIAAREPTIGVIFAGELRGEPGAYELQLRAKSASGERVLRSAHVQGTEQELLAGARREAAAVRDALVHFVPDPAAELPAVTTNSPHALRYFARGVEVAGSIGPAWSGSWPKALGLFRKAVEQDPEFAMARAWLALATKLSEELALSHHGGTRRSSAVFEQQGRKSLALARQGFVSDRERLFIEGIGNLLLERRREAIAAFEALQTIDASFLEERTRTSLLLLYEAEGRFDDAGLQVLRLAELLPKDFDANIGAAEFTLESGGDMHRLATFADRARKQVTPTIAQRESSCWGVSWLEHLLAFQQWASGDTRAALTEIERIAGSIPSRVSAERDAVATSNGYFWLTLGRPLQARQAFEAVGHLGQREWNLARLADLLDDETSMRVHLGRQEWAYNPVPFARAGLFERAHEIMGAPGVSGPRAAREAIAHAEEALTLEQPRKAVALLQRALDVLRARPDVDFFNASLSLAQAWTDLDSPAQAIRVLEEAEQARPSYRAPGLAGAWWIKTQVRLAQAYQTGGRSAEAAQVAHRIRQLLSQADADHPFLQALRSR